ncbi:hypothetical protein VKT23_015737 [Stygiomarasmius scandens]|uniref:Heterokaryon incompatibility domain-containing protein n=1 Tax=Marasmiellus scandens TaxID=2682957 RepID=A0ABR1IYL0_9AGAR
MSSPPQSSKPTHVKVKHPNPSSATSIANYSSVIHPIPFYPSHRLVHNERDKIQSVANPESPHLMTPVNICPRRLIDARTLKLVEFDTNTFIPPYAILSHRWTEEVVYDEFVQPHAETFAKSGYLKIDAACRQARQDGIGYIWVDTCCIKQGDPADVSANITSMYAFYQNTEVCYAYLADVPWPEKYIVLSDWFERGWTLQELIAPRTVVFFDKDWQRIGDKHELRDTIYWKTTIPPAILSGEQFIQDIDVLTRMTWAMQRSTTKAQDEAYCLQGLLGVSLEPNYDENFLASFNRLGKALFDAQPELKARLGVDDDLFRNPNSPYFWDLLFSKIEETRTAILDGLDKRLGSTNSDMSIEDEEMEI